MWLSVWRESYNYFGWDPQQVRSDQWMRQDSILCLFENENPVALSFFDSKDTSYPIFKEDSYFRMWSNELLDKIKYFDEKEKLLVCSYFTLASEYRSNRATINYKQIFHALSLKYFCELNNEFMVGTMVKKSGMSDVSRKHGAEILAYDVEEKGLLVDLLYWKKSKMQNFIFPEINELVNQIWEKNNVSQIREAA